MDLWHRFSLLHPVVQITLVISALVLLIVISINRSIEENLVNLLLALQAIRLNSKHVTWVIQTKGQLSLNTKCLSW